VKTDAGETDVEGEEETMESVMKDLDTNGDGKLSVEEIITGEDENEKSDANMSDDVTSDSDDETKNTKITA